MKANILDCTLSVGGALIDWQFGEDRIQEILKLLSQSQIDIVEIGILRAHALGPQRVVYNSTMLPYYIKRKDNQLYSAIMDDDQIPLSQVQEHTIDTVDIIRVIVRPENFDEILEYSKGIQKKGYKIAILIEESGQYSIKRWERLLDKINRINPWACYLVDNSGILSEANLNPYFSAFDQILNQDIAIGFQGANNAQDIFPKACNLIEKTFERTIYIDSCISGIGKAGHYLRTEEIADWLIKKQNKKIKDYVLYFLVRNLRDVYGLCDSPEMKYAYQVAANHLCSYKYTEFFCANTQVPFSDIDGLLKNIPHKSRFDYSREAACKAIINYRKEYLDLIIIILTKNHSNAIDLMFKTIEHSLIKLGIQIVIIDASNDNKTLAVVKNYQDYDNENIIYDRYEGDCGKTDYDQMQKYAYQKYTEHKYIWVCNDSIIPMPESFYSSLVESSYDHDEIIVVDSYHRNHEKKFKKKYDDCTNFFVDNDFRTIVTGSYIFSVDIVRKLIEQFPDCNYQEGTWRWAAPLYLLANEKHNIKLIVEETYQYNELNRPDKEWKENAIERWGRNWYKTVMGLPDIYEEKKKSALKIKMADFYPLYLKSLLELRAKKEYGLKMYRENKEYLLKCSDTSKWKFVFSATVPCCIARYLSKSEQLPVVRKALSIYRRI